MEASFPRSFATALQARHSRYKKSLIIHRKWDLQRNIFAHVVSRMSDIFFYAHMFWHFLTPLVAALLAGAAAGVVVEAASGEPSGWFWHSQSWLWSLVWCRTSHVLGPLLMSGFFQSLALDQSEALMSLSFHPWRAFNRHSLIQSYDNPSRIVVCRVEDEKLIKLSLFLTLSDSICDGCWRMLKSVCVCAFSRPLGSFGRSCKSQMIEKMPKVTNCLL